MGITISKTITDNLAKLIEKDSVSLECENLIERLKKHRERINLLDSTFKELQSEEKNVLSLLKTRDYKKKIQSAAKKSDKTLNKLGGTRGQIAAYMDKLNTAFKLGYKEIMAVRKEFFPNQVLKYKILDYQSNKHSYREVTLNEEQYLENLKALDISSHSSIESILQRGKLIENLAAKVKSYTDINTSLGGDRTDSKFEKINNDAIDKIIELTPKIPMKITIKSGEKLDIQAYNRARGYEAYYNMIFYLKTKGKAEDPIGWIIRPYPGEYALESLMEQYFNMFHGNENIAFYKIGDSFEDFRIMYENKVANSGQVNLQTVINGISRLKYIFDSSSTSGELFNYIREMFIKHGGKDLPSFLYDGLTNYMNQELEDVFQIFENSGGFKAFTK